MNDEEITALAAKVGDALKARGLMIATAESCTGGGIAEAITRIPGSSAWFDRGFVTYSYEAKVDLLGVKRESLLDYGAVSAETAHDMAEGAISRSRAQVAVAVTGVAGPTGGSAAKPVGTVWFGFATPAGVVTEMQHFAGDRAAVRAATVQHALQRLADLLAKQPG